MKMFITASILTIFSYSIVFAASFGALGALQGLGQSLSQGAQERQDQERYERQERLHHDLEMRRIQYEYQQQREFLEREKQERAKVQAAAKVIDEKESQEAAKRTLTEIHSDWETVVTSLDFKEWMKTLPPPEREKLDASWDAFYIAAKITQFKNKKEKSP